VDVVGSRARRRQLKHFTKVERILSISNGNTPGHKNEDCAWRRGRLNVHRLDDVRALANLSQFSNNRFTSLELLPLESQHGAWILYTQMSEKVESMFNAKQHTRDDTIKILSGVSCRAKTYIQSS